MPLTTLIPLLFLIALLPFGALMLARKVSAEDSDEVIAKLREEARALELKIVEFLSQESSFASKSQLKSLREHSIEFETLLSSQRDFRQSLEGKLKTLQATILERESANRELKIEKEGDDAAVVSVLSNYNQISTESVDLERRLADSLKTIDRLTNEVGITEDQKSVLDQLQSGLTNASAQLRDVIVAHQNIYERLDSLQNQYRELEAEYVKLVELQLGS